MDKKSSGGAFKSEIMSNQQLAEKLHRAVIGKFEKYKAYLSFNNNICCADLANTQLISKSNKGFRFLCIINIFVKYVWVVPLKDKKGVTITKALQKTLDESNRKPNKIWVEKGSKFYNRSMKS